MADHVVVDKTEVRLDDLVPGIYRVFWKSGGTSLAAIGRTLQGGRWIASTNWVGSSDASAVWVNAISYLELIGLN